MQFRLLLGSLIALLLPVNPASADRLGTRIPMREKAEATYYVDTFIKGFGNAELMVDTGSGYVAINERTLRALQREGRARYVKQLQGVLANGSEMSVSVYAIEAMNLGGDCWIRNVEAAVFPGDARQILGLSALRKAAPFVFSVNPPSLVLSECAAS